MGLLWLLNDQVHLFCQHETSRRKRQIACGGFFKMKGAKQGAPFYAVGLISLICPRLLRNLLQSSLENVGERSMKTRIIREEQEQEDYG